MRSAAPREITLLLGQFADFRHYGKTAPRCRENIHSGTKSHRNFARLFRASRIDDHVRAFTWPW